MCYALHEHSAIFFWKQNFFSSFILKRIQLKLFVHQKDLFVRYEKNFQGEIAIRSWYVAINRKAPLECSDDHATHLHDFIVLLLFLRDLPRALMIGIPLVTIVYLLTNIGYIAVVGKDGILEAGAVALVRFFCNIYIDCFAGVRTNMHEASPTSCFILGTKRCTTNSALLSVQFVVSLMPQRNSLCDYVL